MTVDPVILPPLTPSSMRMAAAGFPLKMNAWFDALEYPQRMGNIAVGTQLQMRYQNILDEKAALFGVAWRDSLSGIIPLYLPPTVVAGVRDAGLSERLLYPVGLVPVFSDRNPLQIVPVKPGRSTVTLTVIYEMRSANDLKPPGGGP